MAEVKWLLLLLSLAAVMEVISGMSCRTDTGSTCMETTGMTGTCDFSQCDCVIGYTSSTYGCLNSSLVGVELSPGRTQYIKAGGTLRLTCVGGQAPYTWKHNDIELIGATDDSIVIRGVVKAEHKGEYSCRATIEGTITTAWSKSVTVEISQSLTHKPVITGMPQNILRRGTFTLTCEDAPMFKDSAYVWKVNGDLVAATTETMTVNMEDLEDHPGQTEVECKRVNGSPSTVIPATLASDIIGVVIMGQRKLQSGKSGSPICSLVGSYSGSDLLDYSWFKDTVLVENTGGARLFGKKPPEESNTGVYTCKVSYDGKPAKESPPVEIKVDEYFGTPVCTTSSKYMVIGGYFSMTVTIPTKNKDLDVRYDWEISGDPLLAMPGPTIQIDNVDSQDAVVYDYTVVTELASFSGTCGRIEMLTGFSGVIPTISGDILTKYGVGNTYTFYCDTIFYTPGSTFTWYHDGTLYESVMESNSHTVTLEPNTLKIQCQYKFGSGETQLSAELEITPEYLLDVRVYSAGGDWNPTPNQYKRTPIKLICDAEVSDAVAEDEIAYEWVIRTEPLALPPGKYLTLTDEITAGLFEVECTVTVRSQQLAALTTIMTYADELTEVRIGISVDDGPFEEWNTEKTVIVGQKVTLQCWSKEYSESATYSWLRYDNPLQEQNKFSFTIEYVDATHEGDWGCAVSVSDSGPMYSKEQNLVVADAVPCEWTTDCEGPYFNDRICEDRKCQCLPEFTVEGTTCCKNDLIIGMIFNGTLVRGSGHGTYAIGPEYKVICALQRASNIKEGKEVTLACGNETYPTDETGVVVKYLELSEGLTICTCTAEAACNKGNDPRTITYEITALYPPTGMKIIAEDVYKICPDDRQSIEIACEFDAGSTTNTVYIVVGTSSTERLNHTRNETTGSTTLVFFEKETPTAQKTDFKCVAQSEEFPNDNVEDVKEISIQKMQATYNLHVTVNSTEAVDGSTVYVTDYTFTVECKVSDDVQDMHVVVRLICGERSIQRTNGLVNWDLILPPGTDTLVCKCEVRECDSTSHEITLHRATGPNAVTASRDGDSPIYDCPGLSVTIFCDIVINDVSPSASVTLQGPQGDGPFDPIDSRIEGDSYRYEFNVQPQSSGNNNYNCKAINQKDDSKTASGEVSLTVNEVPSIPPGISLNARLVTNDATEIVTIRDAITLSCTLIGATNMTLKCGNELQNDAEGDSTSLAFVATKDMEGMQCVCTPKHVSGCYDQYATLTFDVFWGPSDISLNVPETNTFCPNDDQNVLIVCHFDAGDTQNNPILLVGESDSRSPYETRNQGKATQAIFEYAASETETISFKCKVTPQNLDASFAVEASKTVAIYVLKDVYSPEISTGGVVIDDGKIGIVKPGTEVSCTVLDATVGDPLNIALTCGENTAQTNDDLSVSFKHQLSPDAPTAACTCRVDTCGVHTTAVELKLAYGPTEVKLDTDDDLFELCPLDNKNVSASCSVAVDNVFPKSDVKLKGTSSSSPETILEPDDFRESNGRYEYDFTFRPEASGELALVCWAVNDVDDSQTTETQGKIQVYDPSKDSVLYVNSKECEDDVCTVTQGQSVAVSCDVRLKGSEVTKSSVSYPDVTNPIASTDDSLTFEATSALHNTSFSCAITGCYAETVHITLLVIYGPTHVASSRLGNAAIYKCPDEIVTIYCDVDSNAVYPKPKMTLQGHPNGDLDPDDERMEGTAYRYVFNVNPHDAGQVSYTCASVNSLELSFTKSTSISLTVIAPPAEAPLIKLNGATVNNDTVQAVRLDDVQSLTCELARASSVTLKCDQGLQATKQGTSTNLDFEPTKAMIGMTCVCSAEHVSGCYHLITVFTLDVVYPPAINFTSSAQSDPNVAVIDATDGDRIEMSCVDTEDANPKPNMTISRVITGTQLATEPSSHTVTLSQTMACGEADVYDCSADNGQSVRPLTKSIIVTINNCPPLRVTDDTGIDGEGDTGSVDNSGIFTVTFNIISKPEPVSYKLFKISATSSNGARRKRAADAGTEMDQSNFQASYSASSDGVQGSVSLNGFDADVDPDHQYTLRVINDVGSDGLDLPFKNILPSSGAGGSSGSGGSGQIESTDNGEVVNIIVVSIVACCCTVFIVLVMGFFWIWLIKTGRLLQQKREARRQRANRENPLPRMSPQGKRVWQQRTHY